MSLLTSATAPGVQVNVTAAPLPGASLASTGTLFAAGLTYSGPVGLPIICRSWSDFVTLCGPRQSYTPLPDAVEAYFAVAGGAGVAVISRVVGPAAVAASVQLKDSAATATLNVAANGPGIWGNALSVAVVAGPTTGTYIIQTYLNSVMVESSPVLATTSDAVAWGTLNPVTTASASSKFLTITDLGAGVNPAVVAATVLTGGVDDNTNAGDTQFEAAISAFPANLGPGKVTAPGRTTSATHGALANHAEANNRFALLDAVSGASAATLATNASADVSASTDPSFATTVAGWVLWPGAATGTAVAPWNRTVPPSAIAAGLMAANEAVNDCNVSAAGPANFNGIVAGALGVAQAFSDADRATLNAAGIIPFVQAPDGTVRLKGYVTMSTDPQWSDLSNALFRMQLIYDAQVIGANYDFAQIDGAGKVIAAFNGDLSAKLAAYWAAGSLYGPTPSSAFSVNTGPTVNTPQVIANRQLDASIAVAMSPSAQWVVINIGKYSVGQTIPAPNAQSTAGA